MHEASLMADLLRRVDTLARREGGGRVVRVSVTIGALSHLSAEHFTEHFRAAAAGTSAEGARIDISVSNDLDDPGAAAVLLRSIDVEG